MGGPRKLSRDLGEVSEPLNSSVGNHSSGSRMSFFGRFLLPGMITGVVMVGPGPLMRHAAAQTAVAATDVAELKAQVAKQLDVVKKQLDQIASDPTMKAAGIKPQASYNTKGMPELLRLLADNSKTLGIDPPIAGKNNEELFWALNKWLNSEWKADSGLAGRNEKTAIRNYDGAEDFIKLKQRMLMAFVPGASAPVAAAPTEPVAVSPLAKSIGASVKNSLSGTTPTRTQEPPAPVSTVTPAKVEPIKAAAPVALTPQQVLVYQATNASNDLEMVAFWGANKGARAKAQKTKDELEKAIKSGNQAKIETAFTSAKDLLQKEKEGAETRQAEDRLSKAFKSAEKPHPLQKQLDDLLHELKGMSGDVPTGIRDNVPNVALLDGKVMYDAFKLLNSAKEDAKANKMEDAKAKLGEAGRLVKTEQDFYKFRKNSYIFPLAQLTIERIRASIPTKEGWIQYEQTLPTPKSGTFYNRFDQESKGAVRRIANDQDSLVQVRMKRLEVLSKLKDGEIPYSVLQKLEDAVVLDANVVQIVARMLDFAKANKLDSYEKRTDFLESLTLISEWLADPKNNPLSRMSDVQIKKVVLAYKGLPDNAEISKEDMTQARKELYSQFATSDPLTADYTVFGLFEHVFPLARMSDEPKLKELMNNPKLKELADFRSLREVLKYENLFYQEGTKIPANATMHGRDSQEFMDDKKNPVLDKVEEYRLKLNRDLLGKAIDTAKSYGVKDSDAVLSVAKSAYDSTAATPADKNGDMAEKLYYVAEGLMFIMEAERWNNPLLRQNADKQVLDDASARIERAKRLYTKLFSNLKVGLPDPPNVVARASSAAIQLLAPQMIIPLEGSAMFYTRKVFGDPTFVDVAVAGDSPTYEERLQGATKAQQTFVSLLARFKDEPVSSVSPADAELAKSGLDVSATLSERVGRMMPEFSFSDDRDKRADGASAISEFPEYKPIARRRRPSLVEIDPRQTVSNVAGAGGVRIDDVDDYVYGQLYNELRKQVLMQYNEKTSNLLRIVDFAPNNMPIRQQPKAGEDQAVFDYNKKQDEGFKETIVNIAKTYGLDPAKPLMDELQKKMNEASMDMSSAFASSGPDRKNKLDAVKKKMNETLVAVLEVRLAELNHRLNSKIILKNGEAVKVLELTTSPSEGAEYVKRAKALRDEAETLLNKYKIYTASDVYKSSTNVREAISYAEIALEGLDDKNLIDLEKPKQPEISVSVPVASILIDNMGGDPNRVRFTATEVMVEYTENDEKKNVSLKKYEEKFGEQNLRYTWLTFHNLRTSQNPELYLLDPDYKTYPEYAERHELRYLGVVVRGAKLTNGEVGDFVVRVEPSRNLPSEGKRWKPITQKKEQIHPDDVIMQLKSGTLTPINDEIFRKTIDENGKEKGWGGASPTYVIVGPLDTRAGVIVSPQKTSK